MKLVIGNKNYSSWSFRPWIAMKVAGIPFDEEVISLYVDGSREQILRHSPGGKVPILIDGDTHVWVARDPGIPRGEISGRWDVAEGPASAGACTRDLDGDACRLRAVALRMRHELLASAGQARTVR